MKHKPAESRRRLMVAAGLASSLSLLSPLAWAQNNPRNKTKSGKTMVRFETSAGVIDIELYADKAPKTVANFLEYVNSGHYANTIFHRVIDGFMAQTGDPTGTGTGGSDLPDLPAEFTATPFVRGTVGMARAQDPNSANSQFFIMFAEGSFLNGQYTVFGQVVEGMEAVDKIKRGSGDSGMVDDPDKIISMRLASDAP